MVLNNCDFKYPYLPLSIVIYPFCFVLKIRMLLDYFLIINFAYENTRIKRE